jgi:hypothetical protein
MSTKTTFKRIALVAVAALGLGVLSVAPSSATVSNLTITGIGAGSATPTSSTKADSDSSTAATFTVSGLLDSTGDTITVTVVKKSEPAAATAGTAPKAVLMYDTYTTTNTYVDTKTTTANGARTGETVTLVTATPFYLRTSAVGYAGAKFKVFLETQTGTMAEGSYTYTVLAKTYNSAGTESTVLATADLTITIGQYSGVSVTVAPAKSTAYLGASSGASADEVISSVATASSTAVGVLSVRTYNADGNAAPESITATISGAGLLSFGGISGSSLTIAGTGTSDISVLPNGTAGVATITVSTPTATFAPKTVTFYAKAAKTLTAAVYNPVLKVGANSTAIAVTAVDANGTNWAGQAYIVASAAADALVGGSATTPVKCSYSAADKTHFCPVTTIATGTAKFKVIDASTVALATATSNEVTVTVSNAAPTSVKLAFDKATYAPFEKALITVTVLDKDGKTLQGQAYTNLLAAGGITSTYGFGAGSDTLTAVSFSTEVANGTNATAGAKTYVVYMPASGDVTISATGGTALAAAGQVKVSATASVVNDTVNAATDAANEATDAANAATDAALAAADAADAATAAAQDASDAVAALSASVSKLISSLRAQITSLTNLVIKIQKKVKA